MNYSTSPLLLLLILFSQSVLALVNTEPYLQTQQSKGLHHELSLNLDFLSGNTDKTVVKSHYRLDHFHPNSHHFFVFSHHYAKRDDLLFQHHIFTHLRGIYTVRSSLSFEVFTQLEADRFIDLEHRFLIGSGLRLSVYDTATHRFYVGAGLMHEQQRFRSFDDQSLFRLSSYVSYAHSFFPDLSYRSTTYYQVSIRSIHNFRILSLHDINWTIKPAISLFLSFSHRYDSHVFSSASKTNNVLSHGIRVLF